MAKFVGSINVPTISAAPLSASEGDVYYDTTADDLLFYVNSSWVPVGTIQNISAGAGISVSGSGDSRQVSLEAFAGSSSSGTPGTSFVKSLSSDVYGRLISYENGSVQNASTTAAGIVQLSDSISTTSSTLAATPTAVKSAYDLAGAKAALGSTTPSSISATPSFGASSEASRADHVHAGVTSIAGTENQVTASAAAGSVTLSLPQSISTGSNVTFNRVTASDYIALSSWNQGQNGLVGTATSVTVTTAGTYVAIGSAAEVSITPDFVGQKFFISFSGYLSLNTTTIQYAFIRLTLTDSSNNSISDLGFSRAENFGTSGRGGTVAWSSVWTADTTSTRKVKLYGTCQTTNGLTLSLSYWQLNVMALA